MPHINDIRISTHDTLIIKAELIKSDISPISSSRFGQY